MICMKSLYKCTWNVTCQEITKLKPSKFNFKFHFKSISTIKPSQKLDKDNLADRNSVSSNKTALEAKLGSSSKSRLVKKKVKKSSNETTIPTYKVKAIATADFYDLEGLSEALTESGAYKVFEIGKLIPETCLCIKPKYPLVNETEPRHMFFFEEGTCVFWNTTSEEQKNLLSLLNKHQRNPHPIDSVLEESELMDYSRTVINKSTYIEIETTTSYYENHMLTKSFSNKHKLNKENGSTRFFDNHIYFSDYVDENKDQSLLESKHLLEKYAFSDAIALSVKLGIWEQ